MTSQIVVSSAAEADMDIAFSWYEAQVFGLGTDFLDEVESVLDQLAKYPESCPRVHREMRRCLLNRFPYGVAYVIEPGRVVVLAVMHQAQDPNRWLERL